MGYQRRVHGDCSTARTHLESTCPQSPTTRSSPKKRLPRRLLLRQRPLKRRQRKQKKKPKSKKHLNAQTNGSNPKHHGVLIFYTTEKYQICTLKIKIEKAQIHSIPKNLLPSKIFKNVQMTKPPDFLDQ